MKRSRTGAFAPAWPRALALAAGVLLLAGCSDGGATGPSEEEEPVPEAPATGSYDIEVRWLGSPTSRQQMAVAAAVERWRTVVLNDLPDVPMFVPSGSCFETQPALSTTVDDMLIFVEFVPIDGERQVLGEAGPCYVRSSGSLPIVGYLKLDQADLALMERSGTLNDVVLHEIGHVLGIGTLWNSLHLLYGAGGSDPIFTGSHAQAAYEALGGTGAVPVENAGGVGSRDGHWRETSFGNELMTSLIGAGSNPLSALTAASMSDLGYRATSSTASTYVLGGTRTYAAQLEGETVDLRGREVIRGPKFRVDPRGRVN